MNIIFLNRYNLLFKEYNFWLWVKSSNIWVDAGGSGCCYCCLYCCCCHCRAGASCYRGRRLLLLLLHLLLLLLLACRASCYEVNHTRTCTVLSICSTMLKLGNNVKDRKNDVTSLVTSNNDDKSLIHFLHLCQSTNYFSRPLPDH